MAAAASDALLQTFRDLLASLLGDALSERLLKAALDNASNGAGYSIGEMLVDQERLLGGMPTRRQAPLVLPGDRNG